MTSESEYALIGFSIPQLGLNSSPKCNLDGFIIAARNEELAVVNDQIVHPVGVSLDASLVTILVIPHLSLKPEWTMHVDLSILSSHVQAVVCCAQALCFASYIADRLLALSRHNIPYLG